MATEKKQETEHKDFDTPASMTTEQKIASEMLKLEARMKSQFAKASANSLQIGVTVKDMDSKDGSPILDKTTKEPLYDNYGNPRHYPNKFYVTFLFQGASLTQEVKEKDYLVLAPNKKYFATGYLGEVSSYGKTEIAPIFTSFELLDI